MSKQTVGMENGGRMDKWALYEAVWQMNDTWDIWVYTHMPDFPAKR